MITPRKFCANQTCVLAPLCAAARAQGSFECAMCLGEHAAAVNASCSLSQQEDFCGFAPLPPPPPWTPGGCCSMCPFKGTNTKCMGIGAKPTSGRCNTSANPFSSCHATGYVYCALDCSMSGGQTFCENHEGCALCLAYVYADAKRCKTPCNKSC